MAATKKSKPKATTKSKSTVKRSDKPKKLGPDVKFDDLIFHPYYDNVDKIFTDRRMTRAARKCAANQGFRDDRYAASYALGWKGEVLWTSYNQEVRWLFYTKREREDRMV